MSTLKTTNLQNASAASAAIVLAADGSATANLSSVNGGPIAGSRNRIINGDMRIDQRNAGASFTPTTDAYTVDRWRFQTSQSSKLSFQQNAGSVTPPAGFSSYLGATSLSAYSITSSDIFVIGQSIEGFNIVDLAWGTASAKAITISFWVRSSLTGTFGGALQNGAGNRAYPFTYSISSANTWEQKTVNVTGDTTGTWPTDNSKAMAVLFGLGNGSTQSATAGAWAAGSYWSATGATSVVGTNGATFYITGVQLEPGSTATPFERTTYSESLARCQRYFQRWNYADALGTPGSTALVANKYSTTDSLVATAFLNAPMRTSPTMSSTNATARSVLNSGPGVNVTITGISAGVPNAGTDISGAITITCSNNGLAAGWGWLDTIGIISASAEL